MARFGATLERYVAVAEIARPHGVRGELKVHVYNPDSDLLLRRPPMRLALPSGEVRPLRPRSIREVPGGVLLAIEGVADRDAAEELRGARIEVPRDALDPAGEGEYYHVDLEGCEVVVGGEVVGSVERVASYPTCDALVVARPGKKPVEVPLTEAYVVSIDIEARRIELSSLGE